ncbi:MAG TPA: Ig-like domain-containing protein, partial [Ilumatobacteraceae bacterium]|nr:Ig-like domain-containing protein [Ilumatobacteraceae bacterium]
MSMAGSRLRAITAMVVSFAVIAAACDDGGDDEAATSTTATTPSSGNPEPTGDAPRVFGLNLSEGEPAPGSGSRPDLVVGENLPADRIDEILARLPEWDLAIGEQQEFNWPIESTPPPRTGNVIDVPFPPNDQTPPETVPTGPLEVLRFQPEGDVPVAPYLAITFNQPMVPIGSLAQIDALDVPVSIAPAIEGRWQWIGTRTLRFDYVGGVDRLPMATTYTVTVPAGTESATGGELADTVEFSFTTPAPTVQSFSPEGDSLALEQLFAVVFDQRIDPAAVLETIHLRAGDDEVDIRLATDAEIAADDSARNIREQAADGRWLVFRPVNPLPTDTPLRIEIGPGVPSAEGPAKSGEPKVYIGRTYAPLRVVRVSCNWSEQCPPGSDLIIEFNNMLDVDRTDPDAVTVSPELAGRLSGVQGNTIIIRGATVARTEYTLTIPASVVDVFGQSLGEARTETVEIGSAAPSLQQYDMITTLDPLAPRQELTVRSVNHDELRVRVFAATLDDMAAYWKYANERDYNGSPLPEWEVLADETIEIDGDADLESLTPIDLQRFLDGKPGHVIVLVDPVPAVKPDDPDYWQNRPALTWVQSTSIGADAVIDAERAVVWATDLSSGAPLSGVLVQLTGASATATTGDDGLAELALPSPTQIDPQLLVATKGDDTAVLPVYAVKQQVTDEVRWYVIDDRQVYRPGETMVVKGWARILQLTGDASLRMPADAAKVEYQLLDSYGNELLKGETDLGALGGFDLTLAVPDTANLGQASLNLRLVGESGKAGVDMWHPFQILQYRTPEFEVVTRAITQPPFLSTKPATVAATATYYAGGPLPGAPADWLVTTTPTTYSPPGWDGFTFGIFQPWWIEDGGRGMYEGGYPGMYYEGDICCGPVGEPEYAEYHGTTGADGSHYLQIGFEGADGVLPDLPVAVSAEATVTDVNRQAWASRTDLLVHPSDRYVGLKATRSFVRQGEPLDVEVIVTGVDGAAAPGTSITLVAGRVEWTYEKGEWTEVVVDEQQCTKVTAAEPVTCSFDTALGGEYRVTAVVTGTDGGHSRTELTAWVTGASTRPSPQVELETLNVVPDKAEYAPGDTAELMVQAPWATGEGIATITHHGIRNTQRFQIVDGTAVIEVPIENGDVPQVTVTLEVVGATARTAPDGTVLTDLPARPAYAAGQITLPVPPAGKTLDVKVTPRDTQVVPGGETTIDVTVTDAAGNPVQGAEFAIVVVDEAVLALTGYQLTDPVGTFNGSWYEQLQVQYSRSQIRLLESERFGVPLEGDDSTASTTAAPTDAPAATEVAEESADRDSAGDYSAGGATGGDGSGEPIDV